MKVLFIGGTGLISSAVTDAIRENVDLTLLNRGTRIVKGTKQLTVDIRDFDQVSEAIKNEFYDVVVDWIAFTEEDVMRDYKLFYGRTKQYIFISSASAYQKPVQDYPITEDTPLKNPFWEYSRNKIYCEDFLNSVHSNEFNVTIVRPSHTYDDKKVILPLKDWGKEYTLLKRIMEEKEVIIPDAGTSLWTVTHNTDFAKGFVALLGNKEAYGDVYHITSNYYYTWEQFYELACNVLKVKPNPVHIPTEFVLKHMPEKEGELLGDKHWSALFDNSKIKSIAPDYHCSVRYEDVVGTAIHEYLKDETLQNYDADLDQKYQKIIDDYKNKMSL